MHGWYNLSCQIALQLQGGLNDHHTMVKITWGQGRVSSHVWQMGRKLKLTRCQVASIRAPEMLNIVRFTQHSLCMLSSNAPWTFPLLHATTTIPETIPVDNCPTSQMRLPRVHSKMLPLSDSDFESESKDVSCVPHDARKKEMV